MTTVKQDFSDRVEEIELYFSFVENIITNEAILFFSDGSSTDIHSDLKKIFKANSFLLLYNLSESCIKNAIAEIYSVLGNTGVCYDDLKAEFKKEIILYLKKHSNAGDFTLDVNRIAYDIILQCFDSSKILSGNLDARQVKGLAGKYGFSPTIIPVEINGTLTHIETDKLSTVKDKRNDLAHGVYSFKDCGRDYTISDLILIKNHVIEYLKQIIDNIENYILSEEYLE